MALRIHKYGGTSVDGAEKLDAIAGRIAAQVREGHRVIVVVSAAGETTDRLERMAREISPDPPRRELDMLVTAGERISMALLAIALHRHGVPAISFTGSQSGIITDTRHQGARIRRIRPMRILQELERGRVVIVAGFQGVSEEKEVTTLGRGGSDTTAVALAVAFRAPWCTVYTDVPGVLSADPRCVPAARCVADLSLDAVTILSHLGAGVLAHRAALLGRKFATPVRIAHAHEPSPGTWALPRGLDGPPEEDVPHEPETPLGVQEVDPMESQNVLSVAATRPVWRLAFRAAGEDPGGWPDLAHAGRPLLLHEEPTGDGARRIAVVLEGRPPARPPQGATIETDLCLVSLVGETAMVDPVLLAQALAVLAKAGCSVLSSLAQGLALSFLVPEPDMDAAVGALHKAFIEKEPDPTS